MAVPTGPARGEAPHDHERETDGGSGVGLSRAPPRFYVSRPSASVQLADGRFIWQLVGVLDTYEGNSLTGTSVMPVFSGLYGYFASAFCQVVRNSGCCSWWSALRISTSPLKLFTWRLSIAAATFTGSVDLALAIACDSIAKTWITEPV